MDSCITDICLISGKRELYNDNLQQSRSCGEEKEAEIESPLWGIPIDYNGSCSNLVRSNFFILCTRQIYLTQPKSTKFATILELCMTRKRTRVM